MMQAATLTHAPVESVPVPLLNAEAKCKLTLLGAEQTPVLIIDNFLADPEALITFAQYCNALSLPANAAELLHNTDFYPGLRHVLPSRSGELLMQSFAPVFKRHFTCASAKLTHSVFSLSVAGIKKEKLRPIQSLPHFDHTRANQYALVLYLFKGDFGGTGFYGHRSTGFERITGERLKHYAPILKAEAIAHPEILHRYMAQDNALFSSTGQVPARFNRAIIYPSNCLHSGLLSNHIEPILCAKRGRLTANMLFTIDEVECL